MSPRANRVIRKIALFLMLGFAILGGLFIIGETTMDLHGMSAAVAVASWLAPLLIVSYLAWRMPNIAWPILLVFAVVEIAVAIAEGINPMRWHELWDQQGPLLGISAFATLIALTIYGYFNRTRVTGYVMLAISLTSILAPLLGPGESGPLIGGSTSASVLPGVIAGALFVLAGNAPKKH